MNLAPVVESLELLAARDIDPTQPVYARLFASTRNWRLCSFAM